MQPSRELTLDCMKCGTEIPEGRLEAIPTAVLCVDCKSAMERRGR